MRPGNKVTKDEVAQIIFSSNLADMLPEKGDLSFLIRKISVEINAFYGDRIKRCATLNERHDLLVNKIHSELIYYCPKDKRI